MPEQTTAVVEAHNRLPLRMLQLIDRAARFHPWDAMAPAALAAIASRGGYRHSVETGRGGSTIVLSHASARHVAFAIEGENHITELRKHADLLETSTHWK